MTQLKRRATYQYGTLVPEPRRRGSDIWVYRFFENRNGKRVRRKTVVGTLDKLPTRADAERAFENLRLAANAEVDENTPTMGGVIDRYIQEVLKPCLDVPLGGMQEETALMSFQTAGSYRSMLNKYVSPRWESYKVTEFQRPQVRAAIEQWLTSLLRSARNSEGLAPKTVRHIFTIMKLVFKFAVKWGYLEQNPMAEKRVELPRGSTKRRKRPVQLTAAQFLCLLPRFHTRERVAVALAGWLGPRVSEAFGLQWQDLDMESRVVRFRRGFVQGRITPSRWVELTSTTPAKIMGLFPRKGTIAVGSDADIVLWDPKATQTLSAKTLHMRVDYNPYEGRRVTGKASVVLSRGEVLVQAGKFLGKKGRGKFLKRGGPLLQT